MDDEPRPPSTDSAGADPAVATDPAAATEPAGPSDPAAAPTPGADTTAAAPEEAAAAGPPPALSGLELAPEALLADDLGSDRTFADSLDEATRNFGAPSPTAPACSWCGAPLDAADAATCAHCGAPQRPVDAELVVPGVTHLTSEARAAAQRLEEARLRAQAVRSGPAPGLPPILASGGLDASSEGGRVALPTPGPLLDEQEVEAAIRPPDDEVRRLMRELELEAAAARAAANAEAREPPTEPEAEDAAARVGEAAVSEATGTDDGTSPGLEDPSA